MALTTEQKAALTTGRRFMASRLLIKKVKGKTIPGLTDDFPATIQKIDGTGDDPAPNTTGEYYIAIARDTGGRRNRTIVLHGNNMSENYNAVVSVIDHDKDEIYTINKNNSTGWPSTYNVPPDHMLFDDKSNKLYISVPGIGTNNPVIAVLDLSTDDPDGGLQNCFQIAEKAEADRWACSVFEAPTGVTIGGGNYPTLPRSMYKILALRGGKLYTWYQANQTESYVESPAGTYGRPNNLGSFDSAGTYTVYFTYGNTFSHGGTTDSRVMEPNAPCVRFGNYLTGMRHLKSWYYNREYGNVTLAFEPPSMTLPNWGLGNEANIVEVNLDALIEHADVPTAGYIHYKETDIELIYTPGDPGASKYYYYPCGHTSAMLTNFDYTWDVPAAEAATCQLYSVYVDYEYLEGSEYSFDLVVETAANGSGIGDSTPVFLDIKHKGMTSSSGAYSSLICVDPKQPYIRISSFISLIGTSLIKYSENIKLRLKIYIKPHPADDSCINTVSVLSTQPLQQASDSVVPTLAPYTASGDCYLTYGQLNVTRYDAESFPYVYTVPTQISTTPNLYYMACDIDAAGTGAGIWKIHKDGEWIDRITTSNSTLKYDKIDFFHPVDPLGKSTSFLVVSRPDALPNTSNYIQLFDTKAHAFAWGGDSALQNIPAPLKGISYGHDIIAACNYYEIWIYKPGWSVVTDPRRIREWWDGSDPDVVLGAGSTVNLNDLGRIAGVSGLSFSHQKGESSYELGFGIEDLDYLPWVESVFNENIGAPGSYTGTLEDNNIVQLQRGIQHNNGQWDWLNECQTFIVSEPAQAQEGYASMRVTCKGIIGNVITRSIYEYTHEPQSASVAAGTLTADAEEKVYHYESGGEQVYDWATAPEPKVYVDGTRAYNYTLNTSDGTVTFPAAQTGKTITADFTYYIAGTNEAEDIIICILRQANEVGGCGLDDTYFTDNILGETLITDDGLTYAFSKNNVRNPDGYNKIYVDGIETSTGFTWNYRNGTVTFDSDKSANTITGNCTYFTIQKSGMTLRKIAFNIKDYRTAYDCINEVTRRVAPNYILHEAPNGKIICDFYTQKAAGSEDILILDSHTALTLFSDNPAYYGIANYIISLGQAPLSELPNRCLGRTVTDEWPYGWHPGIDLQSVVDGDPATQITTGYGTWSEGTQAVQAALVAAGVTGVPCISIDMGSSYEIETLIIARGSQVETEGDAGDVVKFSLWTSNDGSSYTKLIDVFNVPPGQNVTFKSGTNYETGTKFRYIRINVHSLGLYNWKGKTNSQLGISEVQAYESEIIRGIAKIQEDDAALPFYDSWGMLDKYGYLTHVARNGQPDPALYTQEKVNADAEDILNEMLRMLSQVQADALYLPGVNLFDTIRIVNGAMQREAIFFIESKTVGEDGDSFSGANYP